MSRSPIFPYATCWPDIARFPSAPPAISALIPLAWPMKATGPSAMCAPKTWPGGPSIPPSPIPAASTALALKVCATLSAIIGRTEFINNLCRKLLSYSLNRSLQLSDEALVDTMQTNLAAQGYGFDSLVETIVLSPQFRNKRIPAPQKPETQIASRKVN